MSRWVQRLAWLALAVGVAGAAGRASQRLLWNDELFTLYTSQLAPADIIRALAAGLDLHPPASYFATKAILLTFGDGLVQARATSLAGFALACVAIGRFIGRSAGVLAGSVAMLIPFVTGAYDYAFEARPYGAMLGLSGLALVCWQASRGSRPRLACIGLAITISLLVSFHYFGSLLVIALAAGEVVRGREQQRPGVWIARGAGLRTLIAFLPLLRAGSAYGAAFWTRPSPGQVLYTYRLFLFPTLLPAAIALGTWSFLAMSGSARRDDTKDVAAIDRAELAVCVALFLSPAIAVAVAYAVGGYHARYAIVMVLGFSGLVGAALASTRSSRVMTLTGIVVAGWVIARGGVAVMPLLSGTPAPDILARHPLLRSAQLPPAIPIVVTEVGTFIELEHYAPPSLAGRLRAIAASRDDQVPEYYEDSSRRALEALAHWRRLAIVHVEDLGETRQPFLTYGDGSWLPRRFSGSGARLELVGASLGKVLVLVTPAP